MNTVAPTTRPPARPHLGIDLGALRANWAAVGRAYCGERVGAVLKNDAYGMGLEHIAPVLVDAGCREFWVSTFEEGLALRRCLGPATAEQRIYLLHGLCGRALVEHTAQGLMPVLCSIDELELARVQAAVGGPYRVAVQLDTGLTRLGLDGPQVMALAAAQRAGDPSSGFGALTVDAWITQLGHINDPDAPQSLGQRALFADWTARLPLAARSMATSSTVFCDAAYHFDRARVGSALYGVETAHTRVQGLAPVATLRAQVLRVIEVPAGTVVGYLGGYRTATAATLATLAIGYADGLPLAMGNRGQVVLAGRPVPVVGEISMGLCSVDVSALAPNCVHAGDWAEVYGAQLPLHVQAARIGINPNALLVTTAQRAHRTCQGAGACDTVGEDAGSLENGIDVPALSQAAPPA